MTFFNYSTCQEVSFSYNTFCSLVFHLMVGAKTVSVLVQAKRLHR